MKIKLTNAAVEKLANSGDRPILVHDEDCRGFCVVVTPAGSKSFYFYGRINRRPKRILIGKFPDLNTVQARTICRGIIGDAAQGKVDPTPRARGGKTLGELFASYMRLHSIPNKRSSERDQGTWDTHLAGWKGRPILGITRSEVSDLIAGILSGERKKSAAHKARALLSSMFTFAIRQGWCDTNPVFHTHRPTYDKRERYITPDEAKKFFEAIGALRRQITRDYVMILILTGGRRQNVLSMEKTELDLDGARWTIPKSKYKGKRVMVIPLVPEAVEILRRRAANTDRFIFATNSKAGHLTWTQETVDKLRLYSGIMDIRLHDLRRTVGAWMNASGVSLRVIQEGLGHADIRTTAEHYTPTENAAVREALEAYAKLLPVLTVPDRYQGPPVKSKRPPSASRRRKASAS
jgi:integrase